MEWGQRCTSSHKSLLFYLCDWLRFSKATLNLSAHYSLAQSVILWRKYEGLTWIGFTTHGNKPVNDKPYACFLCDHDAERYCLSGESAEKAKLMRASWRHMAEILWRIITLRPRNLTSLAWLNMRLQQKYLGVYLQHVCLLSVAYVVHISYFVSTFYVVYIHEESYSI